MIIIRTWKLLLSDNTDSNHCLNDSFPPLTLSRTAGYSLRVSIDPTVQTGFSQFLNPF